MFMMPERGQLIHLLVKAIHESEALCTHTTVHLRLQNRCSAVFFNCSATIDRPLNFYESMHYGWRMWYDETLSALCRI